jgi:hypothetical protein
MICAININIRICLASLRIASPHSTAGCMIKAGLIATGNVFQWTWASTLLQSANVAWNYGVSGPFW